LIGGLDAEWNWLAIEYPKNPYAKLVHYTLGTPCFRDYVDESMSDLWKESYLRVNEGFD
jgi:hypothetical protein